MLKKVLTLLSENRQKKPKEIDFKNIRSILIRPLGKAIGDAVVHTAHLNQLKAIFPKVKIGVIVNGHNKTIFEHSNLVDTFVERNIFDYIKNHKKWDLLLDFENNFNSASLFMDRVMMPHYIMAFYKYHKKHYNLDTIKNYDYYCNLQPTDKLSHYLTKSIFSEKFTLPEPLSILNVNKSLQIQNGSNKITILLCPQGSKREIPYNELAELLNLSITEQFINHCHFIVGYTETSEEYTQNLKKLCPKLNITPSIKTTLTEYIELLNTANLVIAVDGGSLHLACALRKPLLSFFANDQNNLNRWYPLTYPNVPHCMILTKETRMSNDTKNFDISNGIIWLKQQLTSLL